MPKTGRNFIAGKMNKVVDERLLPEGEYIDAQNIRMGSTEKSEIGVIENTKGNKALTAIQYKGSLLSTDALCIGAYEDSATETIYWFVHDPTFDPLISTNSGKLDLIMSYNTVTGILTYHVISIWRPTGTETTLNFNPNYLITGVDKIGDLLFFTDDYNPPRFINVKKAYGNPYQDFNYGGALVDGGVLSVTANAFYGNASEFLYEQLLVVKRPPINAPIVVPSTTSGQENFMESRFICFAYRYRYSDGEYSATSQWTAPVFITRPFEFDTSSMLNNGMVNQFNQATITYNSGGPLVVGIDLLFKSSDDSIIKVIEKIDKVDQGIGDFTDNQYTFSNSKIYTVLPSSEILRLYDNVPKLSKAQTIMGNRLMYGNYVEGYDLIDYLGNKTRIDFQTELRSDTLQSGDLTVAYQGTYQFKSTSLTYNACVPLGLGSCTSFTPVSNTLIVDFSNITNQTGGIDYGSSFSIDLRLEHNGLNGGTLNSPVIPFNLNFSFYAPRSFTSVYDMVTSAEFLTQVGIGNLGGAISANIEPMQSAGQGITFTDSFNNSVGDSLTVTGAPPNTFYKFYSSIDDTSSIPNTPTAYTQIGQSIKVIATTSSDVVQFQFPLVYYGDDRTNPSARVVFEWFKIGYASATYQKGGSDRSLHSNRGYEIGMVYMDEFNRGTTALVSTYNTQHIPCSYSIFKNQIYAKIPTSQVAPAWAKRFKFVCRADRDTYDTIYSNIYILKQDTGFAWILLEGENMRKVDVGDTLIVKADSTGPKSDCIYTTVLEKQVFATGDIESGSPAGTYIKLRPNNFSAVRTVTDSFSASDSGVAYAGTSSSIPQALYAHASITCSTYNSITGLWEDYQITAGARITLTFNFRRRGPGKGNGSCERRNYTFSKTFIASANYNSIQDFFNNEITSAILNSGTWDVGGGVGNGTNVFLSGYSTSNFWPDQYGSGTNYYQFHRDAPTNKLFLNVIGTIRCTGIASPPGSKNSYVDGSINIFNTAAALIFETQPIDTAPDLFYENDLSFPIDQTNGNHLVNPLYPGDDISQDIGLGIAGEFNTGFFNCFTFGNGAESYRIEDSATGHYFGLGNRVNAVAAQDYKEIDRYADITYSGVYNQETNVNKLNEFNLGLVNYKSLEYSFGELFVLDGRETDVRVLQEDRISYVLSGKNLLSDSVGGGAITSVPEVLGTQIARIEKYGISFNPESYVKWGSNTFFTDVKRGAVIQLIGDSYSNEQLAVISEMGMRTWFRDTFIDYFDTQKLGAFDPYMNEYVLSSNDRELPIEPKCIPCGTLQTFAFANNSGKIATFEYCVDVGSSIGSVQVNYNVISQVGDVKVEATYGATTVSEIIPPSPAAGFLNIFKNNILDEKVYITLYYDISVEIEITVNCPIPQYLRVIEVVYTSGANAGDTIHVQYDWNSGAYSSALTSRFVDFDITNVNPYASWYNDITGVVGAAFPPDGATMRLYSNQIPPDSFVFNPNRDEFRYLRTSTLYNNNPADLLNLYNNSISALPIVTSSPELNYADFTVPGTAYGDILYLIWDFREKNSLLLCYSDPTSGGSLQQACCECEICSEECVALYLENLQGTNAKIRFPSGLCSNKYVDTIVELNPYEVAYPVCVVNSDDYEVIQGDIRVEKRDCGCTSPCETDCQVYVLLGNTESCNAELDFCDNGAGGALSVYDIPPTFNVQACLSGPPRTTCSGVWTQVLTCGCCETDLAPLGTTLCQTYRIDNVIGNVYVSYTDCNGAYQSFMASAGNSYDICVQKIQLALDTDAGPQWIWGSYQPTITPVFTGMRCDVSIANPCTCN